MNIRKISLAHGAGGREMNELLEWLVFSRVEESISSLGGVGLHETDDGATIPLASGEHIVVSVDAYTVNPLVFPGGDIGKLAACGSINDVVMMGGKPLAVLDAIVAAEGLDIELLSRVYESFLEILRSEQVALLGGDFKVMPRGSLDTIIFSTTCIGVSKQPIVDSMLKPGDKIIVTGYLGDHGATILALQQGLSVEGEGLVSDVKPLTALLNVFERWGGSVHAARDPTRGGLAAVLNEWAKKTGTVIVVEEGEIPVRQQVRSYAELLGLDPLYLASEGVAVLGVDRESAEDVLVDIKRYGFHDARIVGEVREGGRYAGIVLLRTEVGGHRILEAPTGELVPRIC
ncbi:MAG: hydrogenase expression/formation protein HypE [Thermofilaceae archaeon]|nr:hydrogenase expression/formation protein HypE [Thermofilaceae archaeon]MCX8180312.1 hydrogenase expression/formation protein HypE [Thermofilaceae archaeon]MDW8003847.1 hydrogenase expression/formation protein HypE [Thermofilaceae archaeon]